MVSFQCDGCADTVKKPQLDKHRQRCWSSFTCLDCSKTFQNQDYKTHTSCISEAEKYQGALYKGPKNNHTRGGAPQRGGHAQRGRGGRPAAPVSNFTEAPTPNPAEVAPASIHPSRQAAHDAAGAPSGYARGGFAGFAGPSARGGRAGAPPAHGKWGASGENALRPQGGMRSWGSPADGEDVPAGSAAPTAVAAAAAVAALAAGRDEAADKKAKKKRKGDKGGTGSKANSKNRPAEDAAGAAPAAVAAAPAADAAERAPKKRKREAEHAAETPGAGAGEPAAPSDKTVKRVRKQLAKLAAAELSLADFVEAVRGSGGKSVDGAEALRALKVGFADGKWVVSA